MLKTKWSNGLLLHRKEKKMKIGRRIYFDKQTGNVLVDTGERQGFVKPTTIEQDIQAYKALSERNDDTFDYIELEFGQYAADFAVCNGYRVNPETKQLEFSYPDPSGINPEPTYQEPLSDLVLSTQLAVAELGATIDQKAAELQMAVAELGTLINQGGNE